VTEQLQQPALMKHDTPQNRAIAEAHCILVVHMGSDLHGTALTTADRDEMGLCIEPPEYVVGVAHVKSSTNATYGFEQYEHRTQPAHVRSGPGDLDYTCFGLRKFADLASKGNPNVLPLLFAPDDQVQQIAWPGHDLRMRADMFISRAAAKPYINYLDRHRKMMLGELSPRTYRPELIEAHGWDVKAGYHAVRIAMQGVELLSIGAITLPVPEPDLSYLLRIREGKIPKAMVLDSIDVRQQQIVELGEIGTLPDRADHDAINEWLVQTYRHWWQEKGL
jgi:hypothetical protein